jgi:dienelactone hydrolase
MVGMASVALFHSVYGLRPAVRHTAERLRAAGHQVVAPDLYQAAAVDSIDEGFLLAEKTGWETLLDRARAAVRVLGDGRLRTGATRRTSAGMGAPRSPGGPPGRKSTAGGRP